MTENTFSKQTLEPKRKKKQRSETEKQNEDMERTNKITEKLNPRTRKTQTMIEFKSDVIFSADVYENSTGSFSEEDIMNQLNFVPLTGLTWDADLNHKIETEITQETDNFWFFETVIRNEISGCIEKIYKVSVSNEENALESNTLYEVDLLEALQYGDTKFDNTVSLKKQFSRADNSYTNCKMENDLNHRDKTKKVTFSFTF